MLTFYRQLNAYMNTYNSTKSTAKTISIKQKYSDNYSYYVDDNGLLKGEWGGFKELETKGPNGEMVYELYYTREFEEHYLFKNSSCFSGAVYSCWIVINEYGYFYNKFSCQKYDIVEDIGNGYYRCEKNGKHGIINNDEQEILHVCYSQIWKISNRPVFLVRCETGLFVFNVQENKESKVYVDIDVLNSQYLGFIENDGYGLMNYCGDVVIQPKFERRVAYNDDGTQLQIDYYGEKFGIVVKNDLFYGKISPKDYDYCFKMNFYDFNDTSFYITKKGGKYGILNYRFDCVIDPSLDSIPLIKTYDNHVNTPLSRYYIIGKQGCYYKLFSLKEKTCIIDGCSSMDYCLASEYGFFNRKSFKKHFNYNFVEFCKNGHYGVIAYNGIIICHDDYDSVELFHGCFLVSKNHLFGLLSESGDVIKSCDNDEIRFELGYVVFIKEGKETKKTLRELQAIPKETELHFGYEPQHYSEYAGSYAQDEMGYSDEDIDTIFDGDPSAYWNID